MHKCEKICPACGKKFETRAHRQKLCYREECINELVKKIKEGKTASGLAEKYGLGRETIREALKRVGKGSVTGIRSEEANKRVELRRRKKISEARKEKRKEVKCDQCGKTFDKYPSTINEHNFCSRECYREFQRENKIGFSGNKIKGEFECEYCGKIFESVQALGTHVSSAHKTSHKSWVAWNRIQPDLSPSSSLAYILGVMLGDGCCYTSEERNEAYIEIVVRDKPFAECFFSHCKDIDLHPRLSRQGRFYRVVAYSKTFANWYNSLDIEEIEKITSKFKEDFIRGFYDSEGNMSASRRGGKIRIVNTNLEYLELIQRFLNDLNIESLKIYQQNGNLGVLQIGTLYNILKFVDIIRPTIKLDGLDTIKSRMERLLEQEKLYMNCMKLRKEKGWGRTRIAREIDGNISTVGDWLYKGKKPTLEHRLDNVSEETIRTIKKWIK